MTELVQFDLSGLLEQVASLGLKECGVQHDALAVRWERLKKDAARLQKPIRLVVSLDNSDTDRALLEVLKTDMQKVLKGMQLAAGILGASEAVLFVPEEADFVQVLAPKTAALGIRLEIGNFVDRRKFPGAAFHHIVTMAQLTDIAEGCYENGSFVAVREKGVLGPLTFVQAGTRVGELLQTPSANIKGILIGSELADKSAVDRVVDADMPLGNGVITVLDQSVCMVDEAEKQLEASNLLSCGKCTFCREGLLQLHGFVKDITKGKGKTDMLPLLKEIGEAVPQGSLCDIGKTGAAFLLDSLQLFGSEYEDHIRKKRCSAAVCTAFVPIYIDPELCTGCEECVDVCPVNCIEGKAGYIHMIDDLECTKCGLCIAKCDEQAIIKGAGRVPKLPERLTKCGKFKRH